jgi:protection-of-telomeres protein 1
MQCIHADCEPSRSLRGNPKELSLIKDRLFHLWGDLEEQKSQAIASGNQNWEAVKSVPFNCCIKEYGVPCTHVKDSNAMDIDDELCSHTDCFGWERRFAIFDTIIHAP